MARRPQNLDLYVFDYEEYEQRSTKKTQKKTKVSKIDGLGLIDFLPKTPNQERMFADFFEGYNILNIGSAGSGKTVCALYLALQKLITNEVEKIVIVRSATSIRPQGFLPGTLAEKEEVYTLPYKQLVNFLFHNDTAWESLTKRGHIEFITTSYIRGLTFENSIIVFDELQNTDVSECYTLLTRLGEGCRIIICGDFKQNDIERKREFSSFGWIVRLLEKVPDYFRIISFTHDDIVRSDLVKQLIIAAEELDEE